MSNRSSVTIEGFPPAKRQKIQSDADKEGSDKEYLVCDNVLGDDVMNLVMEFLAPRELFRLAFTCKAHRQRVTTSFVVRSAMIHGGYPKQTIDKFYPLMESMSIYVPSPLRLLGLVNGRRCEVANCRAPYLSGLPRFLF